MAEVSAADHGQRTTLAASKHRCRGPRHIWGVTLNTRTVTGEGPALDELADAIDQTQDDS